jgi:acyl-ACP thioesterase
MKVGFFYTFAPTKDKITIFKEFEVTSADVDMSGRMRPGAMANLLVQSAIASADKLGFGFRNIKEQELFWVFSRLALEIYQAPQWYDKITVETWPKDSERILYFRDLILRNQKGEVVAKATSAWLAIDFKTKRPKILEGIRADYFIELKEKKALDYRPEKLKKFQGEIVAERIASFFDIDLNQHLTSTRYIDWMFDSFTLDFLRENYPKKITINYIKETKINESIVLFKEKSGENQFVFRGENQQSNKETFNHVKESF